MISLMLAMVLPQPAVVEFQRPVATSSIVARDPASGEMGVAVQSHWFSVGPIVPWARAGVGAVATQSLVQPSYGPHGLALMGQGLSAPDSLTKLVKIDPGRQVRQVAMVDAKGRVGAHTGDKCIAEASHIVGEQFSVQANLMENETVPAAMAAAYRATSGDLATRMLAALSAAEGAGGDIRGKQSAALLIVKAQTTGMPWKDTVFNLRVEDHKTPVEELRRLVKIARAYNHMNAGDEAVEAKDFKKASAEYGAAEKLAPEIVEIPFWHAVAMVSSGETDKALPVFKRVFAREKRWIELVPRLAKAGILPSDKKILKKIQNQAP